MRRVALAAARRRKERTYPELAAPWSRCRLVVMASEVGRQSSQQLAKVKARSETLLMRRCVEQAWKLRWFAIMSCAVARAVPVHCLNCEVMVVPTVLSLFLMVVQADFRHAHLEWFARGNVILCGGTCDCVFISVVQKKRAQGRGTVVDTTLVSSLHCDGSPHGGVKYKFIKTTFIKNFCSSKSTFVKNHFHQKPLSSKTNFIKNQFHQKPISSEHFLSEGPRRLHTNTACAHFWGLSWPFC